MKKNSLLLKRKRRPLETKSHLLKRENQPLRTKSQPLETKSHLLKRENQPLKGKNLLKKKNQPLRTKSHLQKKNQPLRTKSHLQKKNQPLRTKSHLQKKNQPLRTKSHLLKTKSFLREQKHQLSRRKRNRLCLKLKNKLLKKSLKTEWLLRQCQESSHPPCRWRVYLLGHFRHYLRGATGQLKESKTSHRKSMQRSLIRWNPGKKKQKRKMTNQTPQVLNSQKAHKV
uniref:Piccolo presynaptic cytomatrix protein n=1 Tax=Pipistrellus kuhlii TaxID=59472 RepID=A0A7J7WLV2_PIPKU|nr:piccolo presynaptic cytomatrix protein [Pipistrellus kuhlii]